MSDPRNLYRDEILEHFRHPQNYGALKVFDKNSKQHNPLCGDVIEMYVRFSDDTIYDVGFVGQGCAISISAASILTEYIKDKKTTNVSSITDDEMLALLGVDVSEARKKCALLSLFVLRDCTLEKNT